MEFRSEKTNRGALIAYLLALLLTAAVSSAQTLTVEVRHRHLRGGATGQFIASPQGIRFEEANGKHVIELKYAHIQQITLTEDRLRILTDQDQPRWLGRDREIVFDHLPEGAPLVFRHVHEVLGARFVGSYFALEGEPLWQADAKLLRGLSGTSGKLAIGSDAITFEADKPEDSRSWPYAELEQVARAGRFDLSIMSLEKAGWLHAGPREFRFQLKRELSEDEYNRLWRRMNEQKTPTSPSAPPLPGPNRSLGH
jgi:hypothetical protein